MTINVKYLFLIIPSSFCSSFFVAKSEEDQPYRRTGKGTDTPHTPGERIFVSSVLPSSIMCAVSFQQAKAVRQGGESCERTPRMATPLDHREGSLGPREAAARSPDPEGELPNGAGRTGNSVAAAFWKPALGPLPRRVASQVAGRVDSAWIACDRTPRPIRKRRDRGKCRGKPGRIREPSHAFRPALVLFLICVRFV